jgi:type IV pilus assembly protein PilX
MNELGMLSHSLRRRQTGATLIVGLVLLLVLTVVGVSGMNTATMELTMAANTQYQQDAFQMAEDAIDIAIGQRVYRANDQPTVVNWTGNADFDRRAETTWQQQSNTMAPGSSIGVLSAFHFDVVAIGRGPRNAVSTHTQSFYVVGNPIE